MKIYRRNTGHVLYSSELRSFEDAVCEGFAKGVNFSNADLSAGNYEYLHLKNVSLLGTSFNRSTFKLCSFTDCTIIESSFRDCVFIDCVFDRVSIYRSNFLRSKWSQTGVRKTCIVSCDVSRSDFKDIYLDKCNLFQCDLSNSLISNSKFRDTILNRCKLTNSRFDYVGFVGCALKSLCIKDLKSGSLGLQLADCKFHSNWIINKWITYRYSKLC